MASVETWWKENFMLQDSSLERESTDASGQKRGKKLKKDIIAVYKVYQQTNESYLMQRYLKKVGIGNDFTTDRRQKYVLF